jgi:hypothetical protein
VVLIQFETISQRLYEKIGETQEKPRPEQTKPTKQRRNKLKQKNKMETNSCKEGKKKLSFGEVLKDSLMRGLKLLKNEKT